MGETWDPELYEQFHAERDLPGRELLGGLPPALGGRAADLGCGTGELTKALHERIEADATTGFDSSVAMLEKAEPRAGQGLQFERCDLREAGRHGPFDVVFSNAALQWLPDHPQLLTDIREMLRPGGRLAFQVPANHGHAAHVLAAELATEEPFATALDGERRESPVLTAEEYTLLLHGLGFADLRVELRVYLHLLPGPDSVVDWVRGTLLTWYRDRLAPELWERFLATYRERWSTMNEGLSSYPFTFPRVLAWARRR